ncbi:LysR substrate-binding domain-containing protein [Roseomonas sp. BN140053]|uniref:LysR substrate-binding domain-containing protein n=1 Tax=Roseomonas sp. BN140053 TaxID=3391898 RepID=UPI0039EB135D
MLLRQLRCFVAVARTRSFTAAAAGLHLSQPALGGHVRRLEERLGVVLFERHAKGARLTEAGRAFLPRAEAVLDAAEAAERSVDGFRAAPPRPVSLGVTPTPGQALVPELIQAGAAPDAALRLELRQGLSDELAAQVAAGTLDAALCYDPAAEGLTATPLFAEDLFLVGRPEVIGPGEEIALAELPRIPLVLDRPPHGTRRLIDALAAAEGVRLNVRLEIEPSDMKRAVMRADGGCGSLVPFGLFLDEIAAGRMRARRVVRPRIRRTLFLLLRRALPAEQAAQLAALLRPLVQRRIAEGALGWEAAAP